MCNPLSVVDANYLNGFKRDHTNACRILPPAAIKPRNNRSFDATESVRSPSAVGHQTWGEWSWLTALHLAFLPHRALKSWLYTAHGLWVFPGQQLSARQSSSRALETRSLLAPARGTCVMGEAASHGPKASGAEQDCGSKKGQEGCGPIRVASRNDTAFPSPSQCSPLESQELSWQHSLQCLIFFFFF